MWNYKKGSTVITILIVGIIVIAAIGLYYFKQDRQTLSPKQTETQEQTYTVYSNPIGKFSIEVPSQWKILDQDEAYKQIKSVGIFPRTDGEVRIGHIDKVHALNDKGLSIEVLDPKDPADFYAKFYKNEIWKEDYFSEKGDGIIQIKSGPLEPLNGFQGKVFAIRTNKRIYSVALYYKDAKYIPELEMHVAKIIASLKETS
jgi:hypothetical protein